MTKPKFIYGVLVVLPILMVLGNSMLFPLIPEIQTSFSLSNMEAGFIISAYSLPAGLLIPILGYFSDKYGTVFIILIALTAYMLGSLLAGLSVISSFGFIALISGRILQGVGAAGTSSLAMVLISETLVESKSKKVLGYIELSNGIGKIIAPILGSIFIFLGWNYSLYFLAFFAGLLIITILKIYGLSYRSVTKTDFSTYVMELIHVTFYNNRRLISLNLVAMWVLFTLFGMIFFISTKLQFLLINSSHIGGYLIVVPFAVMAFGGYLAGFYQYRDSNYYQIIGNRVVFISVCSAIISLVNNPMISFFLITLSAFSSGLLLATLNVMIVITAPIETRGAITGLYNSFRFLGVALGPAVFGYLITYHLDYPFIVSSIIGTILGAVNLSTINS